MGDRDALGRFAKGNKAGKVFKVGDGKTDIRRKGGKKSVEVRREKKSVQEQADAIWHKLMTNKKGEQEELGVIALMKLGIKAMDGNEKSIELLVKLMGELYNKTEVTGRDGKDLIPDDKDDILKELERLKEATR